MRLVASRRTDAFEELYRRHAVAVTAVASRTARDRGCADEAAQSAFLALWRRAAGLELHAASLRPWLLTVARNAAIDSVRRLRTTEPLDAATGAADARRPEDIVMQREAERDVYAALAALDDVQREVVELAFFGGLSQTRIAALTGAPLGTVKGRVRLAMRHLRALLAPPAGDPT